MKQIIAIVKPYLVEKVLEALKLAPVEACEVCEVKGYGRQKSYLDEYRGSEYSLAYLPKVEILLWVEDLAGRRKSCERSSRWRARAAWATARYLCFPSWARTWHRNELWNPVQYRAVPSPTPREGHPGAFRVIVGAALQLPPQHVTKH